MKFLNSHLHGRILAIIVAALTVLPVSAAEVGLCPYDVTGNYSYDVNQTPKYLFSGDNQVTYNAYTPWYLDDVNSCYNAYRTPGYLIYFPKCDLDNDGTVQLAEVNEVYYHVHPTSQQTDSLAQLICAEGIREREFSFCYSSAYNRTVDDIEAIVAQYPAAGAILDPSGTLGQKTVQVEVDQLQCTTVGVFPTDLFDGLNACYLATSSCQAQPCNSVEVLFSKPVNSTRAADEYSNLAQEFGGICQASATGYADATETPGFHWKVLPAAQAYWEWDINATAQCTGSDCDCRMVYKLWTDANYPGEVMPAVGEPWQINLSNENCADPRFEQTPTCSPGVDTDGDGIDDCDDPCPSDPTNTCPAASILIEDFEQPTDSWPWAPWVEAEQSWDPQITPEAAHEGSYGIGHINFTYRTDVEFGTLENQVLSMWCKASQFSSCRLGFGSDATGTHYLEFNPPSNWISFQTTQVEGRPPYSGYRETLATTYVHNGIAGEQWYKMEVHVRPDGLFDGQIYAADGITPIGSVQHHFVELPATGVAISAYAWDTYADTLELYMGAGNCIDIDSDGVCDGDDICDGDDAGGDDDGDRVCNPDDLCSGLDIIGDADGDGICDQVTCDPSTPEFYDQSGSDLEWTAGGTCAEMNGIEGPMACAQSEWQRHVNDIEMFTTTYPYTQAIFDSPLTSGRQAFADGPYTLLCYGPNTTEDHIALFDDLNTCYRGTSRWLADFELSIIDFDWGVNVWALVEQYGARAAVAGGGCELNTLIGTPTGFHATDVGNPWIEWEVNATNDCDYYGCRCDITVIGWTNDAGEYYESTVVNDSGPHGPETNMTDCTDSRFPS